MQMLRTLLLLSIIVGLTALPLPTQAQTLTDSTDSASAAVPASTTQSLPDLTTPVRLVK
jgi:hypothetical protein